MKLWSLLPLLLACQASQPVQAPLQEEISVVGYVDHSFDAKQFQLTELEANLLIEIDVYPEDSGPVPIRYRFINPFQPDLIDSDDLRCHLNQYLDSKIDTLIYVTCTTSNDGWVVTKPIRCGLGLPREQSTAIRRDDKGWIDITVSCEVK